MAISETSGVASAWEQGKFIFPVLREATHEYWGTEWDKAEKNGPAQDTQHICSMASLVLHFLMVAFVELSLFFGF